MPRVTKALTDVEVKTAKGGDKPKPLFDGKGLFLLVGPQKLKPDGKPLPASKWWRFKYTYEGKSKLISFGVYPEISLADARKRRDDARQLLANGVDPAEVKKAKRAARTTEVENSFEVVAREWHSKFLQTWTEGHGSTIMSRLEQNVFPWLGKCPIDEIEAPNVLEVLRRVESRGALETAHRIKSVCGQVFRYAIATGRAKRDVAADLKGAMPPATVRNHAAITDPKKVADLLRAIDGYQGGFVVKCALRLAPQFFVRPGELRQAEWLEFDFDEAQWNIPAERMKMKVAHIVPLSSQAVEILRSLQPLTGSSRFVFPSGRSFHRCMSNNAVNAALRSMGYNKDTMTGHGFRAMARTIIDEVLELRVDLVEHQLGHAVKDANGRAYNRTSHLPKRRKMMQAWADYLDGLKIGQSILPNSVGNAE